METLSLYLSPQVLHALGYTLLHSLWQGALAAITTAVLLLALHRQRANLRYGIASAGMLLFVLAAAGTFAYYYQTYSAPLTSLPSGFDTATGYSVAASEVAPTTLDRAWTTTTEYMDEHLPAVVTFWMLGFLAMGLRFLAGLAYVQRLRRYRVTPMGAKWQAKVDALTLQAGYGLRVRVMASGLVSGPMVVGWLKPVILLPSCAISGLSADDLEMILAHEVAHVLRKDYLVNLLQSIAEVVFFYHPAVWFLSASMRAERENCCDDKAVELSGNPIRLARALSALAEMLYAKEQAPSLALAALGPDGSLVSRVRRLVLRRSAAPSLSEGILGVGLLALALLVSSSVLSMATTAEGEVDAVVAVAEDPRSPLSFVKEVAPQTTSAPAPVCIDSAIPTATPAAIRIPDLQVPPLTAAHIPALDIASLNLKDKDSAKVSRRSQKEADKARARALKMQLESYELQRKLAKLEAEAEALRRQADQLEGREDDMKAHNDAMKVHDEAMAMHNDQMREQARALRESMRDVRRQAAQARKQAAEDRAIARSYSIETKRSNGKSIISVTSPDGKSRQVIVSAESDEDEDEDDEDEGEVKSYTYSYNVDSDDNGNIRVAPVPPVPPVAPMSPMAPMAPMPPTPPTPPDNARIARELKKDGLIGNVDKYTLKLDKKGLIVNGKKAGPEVEKKYRKLLDAPEAKKAERTITITVDND